MSRPPGAGRTSLRSVKREVAAMLGAGETAGALERLTRLPLRQAVNPLFGLLCDPDPLRRWRAVTAMGAVVCRLADEDLESARVVMRRFIWNLNEESGGIGWGCPESMGESMARHARLAEEYGGILISYLRPECNYIDHPPLQQGVLWGLGRLAEARPASAAGCGEILIPFLRAEDAARRGLAAHAAGPVGDAGMLPHLAPLAADDRRFLLYRNEGLNEHSVGAVAREAIGRIERASSHGMDG